MPAPFLRPKLDGSRFAGHTVPVDVLKDWSALEDMIVEVAKDIYRQENPDRQRVPKGFADGFSLHLRGVEDGSAILDLVRTGEFEALIPTEDLFDRTKALVLGAIAAAALNTPIPINFPRSALRHFDRFGRSLREGEWIQFESPGYQLPIRFDSDVRKRLVLTEATEYSAECDLRGSVPEADHENRSFTMKLATGQYVEGPYRPDQKETIHQALGGYPKTKVRITGTVVFDAVDRPKKIDSIDRVEVLDARDILGRLDDLLLLEEGWLDGEGQPLDRAGVHWLASTWPVEMSPRLEDPYAYPTVDGHLQLEWSRDGWEVSAEIDLSRKHVEVLAQRHAEEDWTESEFDLATPEGWTSLRGWLVQYIPDLEGAQ